MTTKPENPPAFPTTDYQENGITTLDYFAAHIASGSCFAKVGESDSNDPTLEEVAEKVFELAKAMLIERQKHI